MSRAIAFLMCSENEGLGRVSIEAMFYGCLVIGRNSGGTKDFVFDGKTGLLFNDMDGCVSAMQKQPKLIIKKLSGMPGNLPERTSPLRITEKRY